MGGLRHDELHRKNRIVSTRKPSIPFSNDSCVKHPSNMEFLLHNKRLLQSVDTPMFTGWAEAPDHKIVEGTPKFKWKGAKIPFALWSQIVCFLRWTQEEFGEEAMVTLFYHPANRTWGAWAFPQEPNGMTVKHLSSHPQYAEDRARFGAGWVQSGSVHHHCKGTAFQSGTDTTDEQDRDGVHITLGKMEENVLDTHIRQVFDGVMGDTNMLDWIDVPEYLENCPHYLVYGFADYAIRAVRTEEFPDEWKERIYERPKTYTPVVHQPNLSHFPGGTPTKVERNPVKGTTVLTRTSSTNNGGGNGGHTTKNITEWEEKVREKMTKICGDLSLTPMEAFGLISSFPSQLSAEDIEMRRALSNALLKDSIPQLYAETILEGMLG